MSELKVFYCLFLLTLLNATSQIRPSLHDHNNGAPLLFSRSFSRMNFSFVLSLSSSRSVFSYFSHDCFNEDQRQFVSDVVKKNREIPTTSRDVMHAKKRDEASGDLPIYLTIHRCRWRSRDARELCAPSAVFTRSSSRPSIYHFCLLFNSRIFCGENRYHGDTNTV